MTKQIKQARDAISRMIENGSCPESIAPHIDTILDLLDKEIDGGWQPMDLTDEQVNLMVAAYEKNRALYMCKRVYYKNNQDAFTAGMRLAIKEIRGE